MSTDNLLPATIPSYALASAADRSMNADALVGISTGYPPSIRIKASKFRIVDGNGGETILKPQQLASSEYLPVVILKPRVGMNKVYYAQAFDPNQAEPSAPDCFSMDGEKPDPSVKNPMCSNCAACPMNAFGSGRNQAGQPTKGKACSDNKILAVLYNGSVYQFKIPPASLKNWGLFVKKLDSHGVSIGAVITYIGFDDQTDYSVLTFHAADFVKPEQVAALEKFRNSPEVAEICGGTVRPVTAQVAMEAPNLQPGPAVTPTAAAPVVNIFGGDAPVAKEKPVERKPRAVKAPPVEVVTEATEDDSADADAGVPSDAEILAKLGL